MTPVPVYLVCPACEHSERLEDAGMAPADRGDSSTTDEGGAASSSCPECGSRRAYRHHEPALPDAESEAYVKLDVDSVEES